MYHGLGKAQRNPALMSEAELARRNEHLEMLAVMSAKEREELRMAERANRSATKAALTSNGPTVGPAYVPAAAKSKTPIIVGAVVVVGLVGFLVLKRKRRK